MSNVSSPSSTDGYSVSYEKQKRIFKIIVIGDSNVGKTCLTYRFCGGKFPLRTEATIGVDFRERQVIVDDEPIKLQLWDTAGQERFRKSMIPHYYRNVHAVVFVYDVTKMVSFQNLSHWIGEFNMYQGQCADIPKILVGNKCDCKSTIAVSTNMAQKFADSHDMPLFETSATDDNEADHVDAIFMTLAHKLKNHKPMMTPSSSRSFSSRNSRPALQLDYKKYGESESDSNKFGCC
ncbi:putative Ras-related protein Rab-33 [Uloborus diversus]|uniref:putative Ras-related protein Rab-33 n=1 Tax=Uloborus diversus TaxID=327109 RepID=UPI002409E39E|nr:putative Ras-related protein Rab-33 [Uloborus diversus]XP_054721174.1 putative Ras-related protein Rab-33 [Uloborus diversus]